MDNYIYQNWGPHIYRINCKNMNFEYVLDIFRVLCNIDHWLNSFVKKSGKFTTNVSISKYIYIERFYNGDDEIYLHKMYLFKEKFNFDKLIIFLRNNADVDCNLTRDFITNYKKYQQQSIIKNIIE